MSTGHVRERHRAEHCRVQWTMRRWALWLLHWTVDVVVHRTMHRWLCMPRWLDQRDGRPVSRRQLQREWCSRLYTMCSWTVRQQCRCNGCQLQWAVRARLVRQCYRRHDVELCGVVSRRLRVWCRVDQCHCTGVSTRAVQCRGVVHLRCLCGWIRVPEPGIDVSNGNDVQYVCRWVSTRK